MRCGRTAQKERKQKTTRRKGQIRVVSCIACKSQSHESGRLRDRLAFNGRLVNNDSFHSTMQHVLLRLSKVRRAARVAASKTSSTPSPVSEEHSRYFRAPTSAAASLPAFVDTNRRDFFRISSAARGSSRRSFFSPTSITGTSGHRSCASSIHCERASQLIFYRI